MCGGYAEGEDACDAAVGSVFPEQENAGGQYGCREELGDEQRYFLTVEQVIKGQGKKGFGPGSCNIHRPGNDVVIDEMVV